MSRRLLDVTLAAPQVQHHRAVLLVDDLPCRGDHQGQVIHAMLEPRPPVMTITVRATMNTATTLQALTSTDVVAPSSVMSCSQGGSASVIGSADAHLTALNYRFGPLAP